MRILECQRCGLEGKVPNDVIAFTCSYCVNELLEPSESPAKKKVGYPRGWKFMKEFVHADGTVYHSGVEQPDLKGKKKATPIAEKVKTSKKEKAEQKQSLLEEYHSLKKKLKTEKRKTVKKKLELRLSKITKLI